MLILRDVLMPVVDLAELFGNAEAETERWGVVVEVGGIGRVALFIDAVHDQEEIVIRPVSPLLGAAGVYSGATVLVTRSEEHTSELPSLMRMSYDVFCLKKKKIL